jgi:hypothetical protein
VTRRDDAPAYPRSVDARPSPPVRRVRDGIEVEDRCAPHEPLGILVSSPLHELGARARCWAVGDDALLTVVRVRPGLVTASVVLGDPAAASAVAGLVRRSGANRLIGGAEHVDPVAALVPGTRTAPLDLLARRRNVPLTGAWRDRARVARPEDVPALVALYRRFELENLAPERLDATLAGLVAQRRVVLAVEDGEVVAAQRIEARSRHWDLWSGLTVAVEHRGKGLSRVIDLCSRETSLAAGRGTAGVRAPTNHVPHRADGLATHPWREVRIPPSTALPRRARRWAGRQARRAGIR